jgi:TIR domain
VKVFISWSGPQSKKMAESLRSWLQFVIQSIEPFVSSVDIAKGDRGMRVIATELEKTSFGIICVTRDNSTAPWINFEAGALSKAVGDSSVIPCLLDMPVSDLTGPLTQFQVVSTTSKDDVFSMVRALRDKSDSRHLNDDLLRTTFDAFWPKLEESLEAARGTPGEAAVRSVRDPADVLEEVLVLARRQEGVLRAIVERVDSSVPMREFKRTPLSPSDDASDLKRGIVEELIEALDGLDEGSALTYRAITDRAPEEIQVVYDSASVTNDNVERTKTQIEGFVKLKNVNVTVKTVDGYQIIAGPGKSTVLLTPADADG